MVGAGGGGLLLLMHPERPNMMNNNPNDEIRIRYPPAQGACITVTAGRTQMMAKVSLQVWTPGAHRGGRCLPSLKR